METILRLVILSIALGPLDDCAASPALAAAPTSGAPAEAATEGGGGASAPAILRADGDWRAARWGISVEEVLAAFPGEAFRIDPPVRLADGNVVAVGIDGHAVGRHVFRVRFVFEAGKLALVSLRTPPDVHAGPDVFTSLRSLLAQRLGGAGESTADDAFIDMRQTRWKSGRTTVDLKYIPGVVVILYHP